MAKFYETLPQKRSPRVDSIYNAVTSVDVQSFRSETVNLLSDPVYVNSNFQKRRSMYIKTLLETLPLQIFPNELIFGSFLCGLPRYISDTFEERREYADLSLNSEASRALTDEELRNEDAGRWNWGHTCIGLEKVLKRGYIGMAEDAEAQISAMKTLPKEEQDEQKLGFWQSVSECCQAVVSFAGRYARYIREEAEKEEPARREEMLRLADSVEYSPAYPPRNFYEAVQGTWMAFMCNVLFCGTDLGRLDQILYPYYKKDMEEGTLTLEFAQELLDCLWIKCFEGYVKNPVNYGLHPSIMLAGINAEGKECTNELTYMCLMATRHVCTPTPKLSVRFGENTPDDLYELSHIMLTSGLNMPDFYNEKAILHAYDNMGVPFEDAVCFAQSVCEEVSLAGLSEECTNEGLHIWLHDMVMKALHKCKGKEVPFEELLDMVDEEIRERIRWDVNFHLRQTEKLRIFTPQPLQSATIQGCIESGKDILWGGAKYNNTGSLLSGIATASNSLYTIKRLVYDEKRMTLDELIHILDVNYEGYEPLRAEILSKFPKYGNDIDEVDQYAVRMYDVFSEEVPKYKNNRGGVFKVGAWASGYRHWYQATPDGRRQGDSFATNISPTPGTDQKGATAVIRSATKLNLPLCSAGSMVDITISPSALRGEPGKKVLRQLLNAYASLGGTAIQFNLIDSETLEKAAKEPLNYKNLMVRVWGYNDYFVALSPDMQKNIIDRTKHEEGV